MAKSTLLETTTATFLELLGNGKVYRVPPYQRDYSWQEEHWEDLWNDILVMRDHSKRDARHYMGAIVLETLTDREFRIIDGQQRLATLSLLAIAVLNGLQVLVENNRDVSNNRERLAALRSRFIGEKDPASLVETSKLFLNENDHGFYQDYLIQGREPANIRRLPYSNRLLWQAFLFFKGKIEQIADLRDDGFELAQLLSEIVARQLLFMVISVDDDLNAYTIFETLNARGLALSSTDLLKNHLFSCINAQVDLHALQRRWRGLMSIVQQEKFPEFLRYHLLCHYASVAKTGLFQLVRAEITKPQQVFSLMDHLETRAELFAAVGDPHHEYWLDRPACRPYISQLKLFKIRQMMPLIFAAWEKCEPQTFEKILRMVTIISFRFAMVSKLNPNELEKVYHPVAKAVLANEANTPEQIFFYLRKIYVADDIFKQDFSRLELPTSGSQKRVAKYILACLESEVSGRYCDPETDPGTIEHILPENPPENPPENSSMAWEVNFPEKDWTSACCRLGNLTLLESAANRRVGNGLFKEKLHVYQQSGYVLTQTIPDLAPEVWTLPLINKRQENLAKRAVYCWRLDYGEG